MACIGSAIAYYTWHVYHGGTSDTTHTIEKHAKLGLSGLSAMWCSALLLQEQLAFTHLEQF